MATFSDPAADANDASEAFRGLAHASRQFAHPSDMYKVIGDLLASTRSLQQVLDQLAETHVALRNRAADDHGDPVTGTRDAFTAADHLREAAKLVSQVEDRLDSASQAAGRIAWHRGPVAPIAVHRWVSIIFIDGEDADEVLEMIDRDGVRAGIRHLEQWDFGDETTGAAMENGHVYDETPRTELDREVDDGEYRLTYSAAAGHVALYRRHTIPVPDEVDIELLERAPVTPGLSGLARNAGDLTPAPLSPGTQPTTAPWFKHPGIAQLKRERGLGL